ncbi:MAG: hypothetical protein JWQ64_899 [Subtercola sp.]|nr:hypothetical protein [Subtercola sp.]
MLTAVPFGVFVSLSSLGDVPVDPSAPDARQWLIDELSKPQYTQAKPTLLDRAASAFGDWLASLVVPSDGNLGGLLPVLAVVILIALVVAAFIVFGRPRRNRQAATRIEALFGSDDRRTSTQLRASAAAAASAGDYVTAIEEMYRSIARRQAERTVVRVSPGTTARDFAVRAGQAYTGAALRLESAAQVFDSVRYLGGRATPAGYEQLAALETELRDLAPERRESVLAGGPPGSGSPGGPPSGVGVAAGGLNGSGIGGEGAAGGSLTASAHAGSAPGAATQRGGSS